jgi:hypothetical protein
MIFLISILTTVWAGSWQIEPSELPVHTKLSVKLTYTVGPEGLTAGDAIRVEDPLFHGIRWAMWGFLTTNPEDCTTLSPRHQPASAGLVTASTNGPATLHLQRTSNIGNGHSPAASWVEISGEDLLEGHKITFVIGDSTDNPLCGLQTSPRTMEQITWPVSVRYGQQGIFEQEPNPPLFEFTNDGTAETLLVSTATKGKVGEPIKILVAALDQFGNAVPDFDSVVTLSTSQAHTFVSIDKGLWETSVTWDQPGIYRVEAESSDGLTSTSNPVQITSNAPEKSIYWGDIHTHHGHSFTDESGFYHDTNHEYARDVIGLQVGCETMKASPQEIDSDILWETLKHTCKTYTDDTYVALLGFEWMGAENSPGKEGHHNVYYNSCDGPLAPNTTTGLVGDSSLWEFMQAAEDDFETKSLSIPHASSHTGFNWRDRDDQLRPSAEIYSGGWGSSSQMNEKGASVYDALALGHRMGLVAASDNHMGWLGNRWAARKGSAGLTAFVTTKLSRETIYDAIQEHTTYATTGHRPILSFVVTDETTMIPMGKEYVAKLPKAQWEYIADGGTVKTVELLRVVIDNDSSVEVLASWAPGTIKASGNAEVHWNSQNQAIWLHIVQDDDSETWSSPIWLSNLCDGSIWDPAGNCPDNDTNSHDSNYTGDSQPDSPDFPEETESTRCGGCGTTPSNTAQWAWLLCVIIVIRRTQTRYL